MNTEPRNQFDLLVFDWDGTAVADRHADATELRALLTELLARGVVVAIITGTNYRNLARQCLDGIEASRKEALFVLTNRGSEVYGFDGSGRPRALWRRIATPEEEKLLTRIADAVRDELVELTGLEIEVIYDRLNRRKIDLIPEPGWRDPKKSEFAELLAAVEERLHGAGVEGGIREVAALADRIAREYGLEDPRITSDIKHVEIGLTDKSDSVRWIVRELMPSCELEPEWTLVAGDEFGPIAGIAGSDSKMIIPELRDATYVSVGVEPNGVPANVVHLGGGPPRFLQLLREQLALAEFRSSPPRPLPRTPPPVLLGFSPTTDHLWTITYDGFDLAQEDELESIFTVANGYLGSRGSISEGSPLSSPATFIAGVFADDPDPLIPPGLAQGPDWMSVRGYIAGRELRLEGSRTTLHRRTLDLRQGLLWREWHHEDDAGRITHILSLRLASLADRHILAQFVDYRAVNHENQIRLVTTIDVGPATGYRSVTPHAHVGDRPPAIISLEAIDTGLRAAFASATRLIGPDAETVPIDLELGPDTLRESWETEIGPGRPLRLERVVAVHTTRDTDDPEGAAITRVRELAGRGESIVAEHVAAWSRRWHHAAIDLAGDDETARALHFAAYHLIGAANPEDERVSIGARALTGNVYQGHVFWDTEIYMLPFFTLTHPESARALLLYRYNTLHRARGKARKYGYRGALFPWESAFDGVEATPPWARAPDGSKIRILSGEQEHHINAAVAYAAWQYWELTADDDFMRVAGAELLIETARFWASRGRVEEDGRFHLRQVVGPDEYHESVDDSAYTNLMAQWNMERGAEIARTMRERWPEEWKRLELKLGLEPDEPGEWERLASLTYSGLDPETGIIEQFKGYHGLEWIDLESVTPTDVPPDVILGHERIRGSQIIKQADVVLLILLLWDRFTPEVRNANFDFYEPRCAQGSSLSPAIHALVAARLGRTGTACRYLRQAATIDLGDSMGNSGGGVHAGALGAFWQAVILGFAGYHPHADRLEFEPRLPPDWRSLDFRLQWRGRTIRVSLANGGAAATAEFLLEDGAPAPISVTGAPSTTLAPGTPFRAIRTPAGWTLGDRV